MIQRLAAEAIGTFWLVFAGCGSALLSAGIPGLGIGVIGIAFAFGVAVVTAVYALAISQAAISTPPSPWASCSVNDSLRTKFPAILPPK